MRALILILGLIAIAVCIIVLTPKAQAQLNPGDILVVDLNAGTDSRGALFSINPVTGNRTVISDFGNASQGTVGSNPFGVSLGPSGDILVIDADAGTDSRGALFSINPVTGNRTVISDFGSSSQGTVGATPVGVAPGPSGDILVIDQDAGTGSIGVLFSVNPVTGNRTVISDFGSSSQGTVGVTPSGVALGPSGDIVVADGDAGTDFAGVLFSVHPVTGNRTVKSDFSNPSQGPEGGNPVGVAPGPFGDILVIDDIAGTDFAGVLFSVHPVTGNRTVISDFGNSSQGTVGDIFGLVGVAPGPSGDILVIDQEAGTDFRGALFSVNPVTGNRTVISDFGIPLQGSLGIAPVGVAVFPQLKPGDILVIDQDTGTGSRGALFSVNQFDGTRKVLSNFGIFPQGDNPDGLAVGAFGDTLVIDEDAGTGERGALFSVNSFTGIHTMISDFGDPAQGQLGVEPVGVAREASGNILVIDRSAGTEGRGTLFRVNPTNGNRTIVSNFGNFSQGELGLDPVGIALNASGNVLVIDSGADILFSVNPSNGNRTVISDFADSGQGPLGIVESGLALGTSGNILVIDEDAGTDSMGALFSVNPANGNRTIISNFGDPAQGQLGLDPNGVALGPSGDILVVDHGAGTNFLGALFDINPANGNRVVISDFGNSLKGPLGGDLHGLALVVSCGGKLATRVGTVGADNITGTAGPDVINLLGGNDTANSGDGNDIVCGGAGNDTMNGGNGRDRLLGQGGNDILNGDAGNDRLKGGGGNDNMNGGTGNDRCIGGPGSDTASSCETTTGVP
ncbi:MAG TPA: hypothetical protein VNN20_02315 [Thermodesulfobacteriota bacterium]|nr:hypothetical protein [Thermodesulfobacteriota bacterium]